MRAERQLRLYRQLGPSLSDITQLALQFLIRRHRLESFGATAGKTSSIAAGLPWKRLH
jgi:hypothetical protein